MIRAVLPWVLGFLLVSCESAELKQCRSQYLTTHSLVSGVDPNDIESVKPALEAVRATEEACKKAQSPQELAELGKVHSKLESNFSYLQRFGSRKKLTPEEVEKLLKEGDPGCPKGQAYNYQKTDKQVRCTGAQVVDLKWAQAKAYFEKRGYRLTVEGAKLKAEYGSESYHYHFAKPQGSEQARCLQVFAAPGIPWEESVARVTGAHPMRLKKGQTVRSKSGRKLALRHTDDQTQAIYALGDCPE